MPSGARDCSAADQALASAFRARLAEIGVGNDATFCRELLTVFADDVADHIVGITCALAAGDAVALARTAHALKGSAANLHAAALAAASLAVERHGKTGTLGDISGALDCLRTEAERVPRAMTLVLNA